MDTCDVNTAVLRVGMDCFNFFLKNNRFVMKTSTKKTKKNDRFENDTYLKEIVSKTTVLKRSFLKTQVFYS